MAAAGRRATRRDVQIKPRVFTERGFVFVSTNYRLLYHVEMDVLVLDVAKSMGWVHKNMVRRERWRPRRESSSWDIPPVRSWPPCSALTILLKAEGVPFDVLRGCVPVDGDTYDLPAIIMTAELRQTVHGLPLPTFGHRVKFGNDPKKHLDLSAVTHVAKGKGIPPFLILHVAGHPDVTAQARRLADVLQRAEIVVTLFGAKETTHRKLNADLGSPEDPATQTLFKFLSPLIATKQ